jgi:hypothetical protein
LKAIPLAANLEVKVMVGRPAAAADRGDHLAGLDLVPDLNQILIIVSVNCDESVRMLDLYQPSIRCRPTAEADRARRGGQHGRAHIGLDVDTGMPAHSPLAEARGEHPLDRPGELDCLRTEFRHRDE